MTCSWVYPPRRICAEQAVASLHDGARLRPVCHHHHYLGRRLQWATHGEQAAG